MKKKIALVAGGYTGESVVSLKSAAQVRKNIDPQKYEVYLIVIEKQKWYYLTDEDQEIEIDKNDFSLPLNGEKILFDCAFIMIHGSPGEDGKLQGYFDLLDIPYTSCDVTTSAITMNKAYTKSIVKTVKNLFTAKSVQLFSVAEKQDELSRLKLPLFVKPNNGGSSIGMSKVSDPQLLNAAIERAFEEGTEVLVEEFIQGREFTVGLFKTANNIKVLPVTEIITKKEFFDFEAKYTDGVTDEITPADLPEQTVERIALIAKNIYQQLNCKGMVRTDFILEAGTQDFYFIEINTIPGQSANSLIPQQVRAAGIKETDFYGSLIEEAIDVKKSDTI